MNKKKVDSILKGVTAAGIAIGGVSTIQGADMVMAQEIENQVNDQTSQSANSMSDSMSDTPSESRSESEANQASENQTETASEETSASQTESTSEQNVESTSVEETEATSETETVSQQTKSAPRRMMAFKAAANNVTAASLENGPQVVNNEGTLTNENGEQTLDEASLSASASVSTEDSEIYSASESASISLSDEEVIIASQSQLAASESTSESLVYSESLSTLDSENKTYSESLSTAQSVYDSTSTAFAQNGKMDTYLENLIKQIDAEKAAISKQLSGAKKGTELSNIKWDLTKTNSDGKTTVEKNADCWKHMDYLADLLIRYSFKQQEDVESITFSKWESSSGTGNYVKVEYKDNNGNTQTAYFDYVTTDKNGKVLIDQNGENNNTSKKTGEVAGIAVLKKTPNIKYSIWGNPYVSGFKNSGNKVEYTDGSGTKHNGNFGKKGDFYFSLNDYENGRDQYNKDRSEYTSASEAKSLIESLSTSVSERFSEKKSEWKSLIDSRSDSRSASEKNSESRSESLSDSSKNSESVSTSISERRSLSASDSTRISESISTSVSESQSVSTSVSASQSVSTSVSQSTSTSTSVSQSESTSVSISTSASASESAGSGSNGGSTGGTTGGDSAGGNNNASASENAGTATSENNSTSASGNSSTSETGTSGYVTPENRPANKPARVHSTPVNTNTNTNTNAQTPAANTPAAPANGNGAAVTAATAGTGVTPAAQVDTTVITDEQVPLAVQDQAGDAISDQGTTSITDEQVPLAANAIAKDGVKTWWWWIAAAVAAITGKGAYDHQRRKPAKNDAEDSSDTDK